MARNPLAVDPIGLKSSRPVRTGQVREFERELRTVLVPISKGGEVRQANGPVFF